MSVAGYIGKNVKAPRKPREVLSDESRKDADTKRPEVYDCVMDYDPVLWAHCRLEPTRLKSVPPSLSITAGTGGFY
jgi:hypothetical protein